MRPTSRLAASLFLLVCLAPAAARAQKIDLRLRPPAGEAIKFKDHYECWLSIGSSIAREPLLEHKDNRVVGRVTSSGTLRPQGGGDTVAPLHVSSDISVDAETGRLIEATIRQEGGVASRYIAMDLRTSWRIQRQ